MRLATVALVLLLLGCQPQRRVVRGPAPVTAPEVYELAFVRPNGAYHFVGWMPVVMRGANASAVKNMRGEYVPTWGIEGVLSSNEPPVMSGGLLVRPPPQQFRALEGWQRFVWGASLEEVTAAAPPGATVDPQTPELLTRVRWSGLVADLQTDVVLTLFKGRLAAVDLYPKEATGAVWEDLLRSKYGSGRETEAGTTWWTTRDTSIVMRLLQTSPVAWRVSYVGWMYEHLVRNALNDERNRKAKQDL